MSDNIVNSRYPRAKIVDAATKFPQFVLQHFAKYGDKVALISPKTNQSLTFADLNSVTRRTAIGLHRNGDVRRRDVVSICAPNRMELFGIMLGANMLGAIVNTANPAFTVRELVNQFGSCQTRVVVTTSDSVEKMEMVKNQCRLIRTVITLDRRVDGCLYFPDLVVKHDDKDFEFPCINASEDAAFLANSSGTTGLPKAIILTHRNMVSNLCQVSQQYLEQPAPALYTPSSDEMVLSAFPLFHIAGITIGGFWILINGGTLIVFDRYDPDAYLAAFRAYKVTTIFVPPPVLVHYAKSTKATKEDFESLKYILCAGAVISKELSDRVAEKMKPEYIIQVYGMTEATLFSLSVPLSPLSWRKSGSCGVLAPNTQCKVIDIESGRAVGPGIRGEICIRGPQVMEGYLNNEKATREAIDQEGWLHTGDIGYYDEDEYFYIVDRIKDIIKVKAFQVAPAELEAILFSHPGIADAVVIGVPDSYTGEVPRAYVVLKPGVTATEEEIKKFIAGHVVSYKRLEGGVVFIDAIPKTPSGKYLRRLLREQVAGDVTSKL